jgi:fructokinase
VQVPSIPVEVIDTVGAGDSFTGGLLCALHEAGVGDAAALESIDADGWGRVLDFAVRVAAVACSRVGADPPWRHELAG